MGEKQGVKGDIIVGKSVVEVYDDILFEKEHYVIEFQISVDPYGPITKGVIERNVDSERVATQTEKQTFSNEEKLRAELQQAIQPSATCITYYNTERYNVCNCCVHIHM